MPLVSAQRREEIIDSLRRGTVPHSGLDAFAVGLERFEPAIEQELAAAAQGRGVFKAVRAEYGGGKTFFSRWLQERAKRHGFATSEVQVSESDTPLHRLETIYRRMIERLETTDSPRAALRSVLDVWFYTLEREVLADDKLKEDDTAAVVARTNELMERRLREVNARAPAFGAVLILLHQKTMAPGLRE